MLRFRGMSEAHEGINQNVTLIQLNGRALSVVLANLRHRNAEGSPIR